jgi:hypothetical protein
VLNIVTGLFVDTAIQVQQQKRDFRAKDLAEKEDQYVKELKKIFAQADSDSSGTLNGQEFRQLLDTPGVSEILSTMDLDIKEAQGLFKLMDIEDTDNVSSEDFVYCCLRVKGDAKSIDLCTLLYEHRQHNREMKSQISKVSYEVKEAMSNITNRVNFLAASASSSPDKKGIERSWSKSMWQSTRESPHRSRMWEKGNTSEFGRGASQELSRSNTREFGFGSSPERFTRGGSQELGRGSYRRGGTTDSTLTTSSTPTGRRRQSCPGKVVGIAPAGTGDLQSSESVRTLGTIVSTNGEDSQIL